MQYEQFVSPLGILWLTGTNGKLTGVSFLPPNVAALEPGNFLAARQWLADYFSGNPRPLDVPMELTGTDFQKRVWTLLLEIPWGKTTTYGQLARQLASDLGRENMSAQAVGQAVGKNPLAILIPCHRVVGASGSLTGYAYGLEKKAWLLRHETK